MKKVIILMAALVFLTPFLASTAQAGAEYDPVYDIHPVKIISYALHPVGVVLEWLVFRPVHAAVSFPYVSDLFGHKINDGINHQEFTSGK